MRVCEVPPELVCLNSMEFYPDGSSCVSLSSANNLLANLYRFHTTCPLPSLPLEERVYGICMVYLKKGEGKLFCKQYACM